MTRMKFVATGDSFITRTIPTNTESFQSLTKMINQADARFTNLETTVHQNEGYPSPFSGGTWAMSSPGVLGTIKDYGFNLIGWANNHTLDYLYGGLDATYKNLDKYELVHSGVGYHLADASSPRYLGTPTGRVAIISAVSTCYPWWVAGEQRPDTMGRPGINPLRVITNHVITPEKMNQLKDIANSTEINIFTNMMIEEGFMPSPGNDVFLFGSARFIEGKEEGTVTAPHPKDMNRIEKSIMQAKRMADYVIISIHSHEMKGAEMEKPADFLERFSRLCIDSGADAIIGHGPHVLRGIEIYKNRPIFYSLGNFIFQTETVLSQPSDMYDNFGLDSTHNVVEALDAMSDGYTRGLCTYPEVWESVLPLWTMKDGALEEILLYPIELGFNEPIYRMGNPVLTTNERILNRLQVLSEPYGTEINIENGVGKIKGGSS
ncbi:CapA family protein [Bacillus massilinigeriensis]|uniref:CapA family protein n=1 Tax=Bacillus massilionigeriensis TaxID=1805475 RepID=UPI00096B3B55|nr:CapA family protein [Bacillus massilionigeriensis]